MSRGAAAEFSPGETTAYRTASGSERDKDATKLRIVLRMLNLYSAPYRSRF